MTTTTPKYAKRKTSSQLSNKNKSKKFYAAPRFPWASQPDIVRSQQKDIFYQRFLFARVLDFAACTLGNRFMHKFYNEIRLLSDLAYYSITTLSGKQTLGEEYCDIMQIYAFSKSRQSLPSIQRRMLLVLLNVLTPYVLSKMETIPLNRVQQSYGKKQSVMKIYNAISNKTKQMIPHLSRFHLALFYMQGQYMQISKRLTSIKYIQMERRQSQPSYQILGILILFQQVVQICIWARKWYKSSSLSFSSASKKSDRHEDTNKNEDTEYTDMLDTRSENTCALCLEYRKDTTATPCGHLFCWTCVAEWCVKQPKCPICRTPVAMNSLAPVYHFD